MRRRARARAVWAARAAFIRRHRIVGPAPQHREEPGALIWHGGSPDHCVCNGTHVHHGQCPRCEWSCSFPCSAGGR
jgi:hypothetical protein